MSRRFPGADAFRAIACLSVFVHHVFFFFGRDLAAGSIAGRGLLSGNNGVAAFFVLSGFLLSLPFWKARQHGHKLPSLRVYLIRRVARILPAYYLCLAFLWVATSQFEVPGGYTLLFLGALFSNSLLPDTYLPRMNEPLWSVSIEMLFYLFLPLTFWWLSRWKTRAATYIGLAIVMAVIVTGQVILMAEAPTIEHLLGLPHLFQASAQSTKANALVLYTHFLIGVLTADIYLYLKERKVEGRSGIGHICDWSSTFLLFAVPLLLAGGDNWIPLLWRVWWGLGDSVGIYHWPVLHLLFGGMLLSLVLSNRVGARLDSRLMKATASLSYGIYIWHLPILRAVDRVWPTPPGTSWGSVTLFSAISLAFTYLVALASFHYLESPLVNLATRITDGDTK